MTASPRVSVARGRRLGRAGIVIAATILAVIVNLVIYAIGYALGGSFSFTSEVGPATVAPITLVAFTALPLAVGMTAAAILSRWWRWVVHAALVIAPVLELGTILVMTVPADFDMVSKVTLALCHVALVPVTVAGLLQLRSIPRPAARVHPTIGS